MDNNYVQRSESDLYNGRGTISNSAINKRTVEKANMYDDLQSRDKFNKAVTANLDRAVMEERMYNQQRLNEGYAPDGTIISGSPADVRMQSDINRGINYQQPGLLDAIGAQLNKASDEASNWFRGPVDNVQPEKSQSQKDQEFEQMQYGSEQAGLAELEQLLNKQQQR